LPEYRRPAESGTPTQTVVVFLRAERAGLSYQMIAFVEQGERTPTVDSFAASPWRWP